MYGIGTKLLLIREEESFLYHALKSRLVENGYEVVEISPDVESFQRFAEDAEICLAYLGEYAEKADVLFQELVNFGEKKKNAVWLIGTIGEVSVVKNRIHEAVGWKSYKRPVNLDALIEDLAGFCEKKEKSEEIKTILMVDDDVLFLKMMAEWLDEKYKIVTVTSGMQAITYLANNTPDLILLDYEMPVTSGPQVMEMIRSEPKNRDIPIMFLTGKNDRESVERVLGLKPDRYLLKSLEREQVLKALEDFFDKM